MWLKSIIAKPPIAKEWLFLLTVILVALFVRLYHISQKAEFLGDQGRTGIVIYQAWQTKTIPLVGPTVLTGQHLGPIWYYLIGPAFIVSNFDPHGAIIAMVMAGVVTATLLFLLGKKLYGNEPALVVSLLYSVSPAIVYADRTIWEPNIVPLFSLLFLFSVYTTVREHKYWGFLVMGATVSVLVQLHYPNVIFVLFGALLAFWLLKRIRERRERLTPLMFMGGGLLLFIAILAPFLYYEFQHGFRDIREIIFTLLSSRGRGLSIENFIGSIFDYSARVFYRVVPIGTSWVMAVVQIAIFLVAILSKSRWYWFIFLLYSFGIIALSFYQGVVFDHYLNFLLPIPFLFYGFVLSRIQAKAPILFITLSIILLLWQVSLLDLAASGPDDIVRTRTLSGLVTRLSNNEPFSFTLIGSRSFSDLHYRYFFLLSGYDPRPIAAVDYRRLFIICDEAPCPGISKIQRERELPVLCYDKYCQGDYPRIDLAVWQLVDLQELANGKIYSFIRRE